MTDDASRGARADRRLLVGLALLILGVACGGASRTASRTEVPPARAATAEALCETGREHFEQREYAAAAEHFDQCAEADPTRAYAYYRAGLAYYEIGRTAMMVTRFERFVTLAPDAPERPQVESILETVRR